MQFLRNILIGLLTLAPSAYSADANFNLALRRAQYLLNGTLPTDQDFAIYSNSKSSYDSAVRNFVNHENFYETTLRYHQRVFGVGLKDEYLNDLLKEDIDASLYNRTQNITSRLDYKNSKFYLYTHIPLNKIFQKSNKVTVAFSLTF